MNIKFLKYAVKYQNKKVRVWYSKGALNGFPAGTITIYARDYGSQLPEALNPENDTDSQTDYFDKDKARITPDNKYYSDVLKVVV